ncbi:DUF1189 domain-containing protein [Clostridiales bacterium COT073_COT-073]|nr:DUF1189 domain-containing protein [Clostridiales bacterium COT073_COT-073]
MQANISPKHNFFQRFLASFVSPAFYIQAIREPLAKAIRYALVLSAILSLIGGLYLSLEIKQTFAYMNAFISDPRFPDFVIVDGRLQLTADNDMELKIGGNREFIAIIDSSDDRNYTHLNGHRYGIFVNRDYVAFKKMNSESFVLKFSQLSNFRLLKTSFQKAIGTSEVISYVFTFAFYFLRLLFQYFFKALIVYALLSFTFPVLRAKELNLKSSQIFSVILYAMSFATLASELFNFISISNQWILSLIVIFFYMVTLRIARTGILAILLDKIGDKLPDSDDWYDF